MNLRFIALKPDCKDRSFFEQVNKEAFPLSERMDIDEIFNFAADTNTDVLGIYDGDIPIGFLVLLKNAECGYLYFFAIDKHVRSKGYGGAAIKKLLEVYSQLQIILDFEEINGNVENNVQRLRRKQFYLRNGFHETGNYTFLREERFEVVCSAGVLKKESFQDLLRILHAHRPEFPDLLI